MILAMPVTNQLQMFLCLLVLFLPVFAQGVQEVLDTASLKEALPDLYKTKQHPELPVLGYVTPWNSRGKQLVETYREKFDLVSLVWYTVHADEDASELYEVRGAPPEKEDEEWYRRLQQPHSSQSRPLQIVPRFMLDGWTQQDFRNLMFNVTRWTTLSTAIMNEVGKMGFDGIVFESGVTHVLGQALSTLSEALHEKEKVLILVMPPIRTSTALGESDAKMFEAQNDMILQSLASLSSVADYFSIMTYDMTGPGGRGSETYFPDDSPIMVAQHGRVREPGPNTNAKWVRENLVSFAEASDPDLALPGQFDDGSFQFRPELSRKFLMGLPLYGYTYPILFIDKKSGSSKRPDLSDQTIAVLRGAGSPVIMPEVLELMKEVEPEIFKSKDGEFFFDYVKSDGYWRAFMPTKESMSHVLDTIHEVQQDDQYSFGGAGVALWEVGQSSVELLSPL